jgi:hypothetical protein
MALSTITRGQARSDLRSRLGKVTSEQVVDDELNYWLNLAQIDIASRLSSISAQWYGEEKTDFALASLSAGNVVSFTLADPVPSAILRPVLIVGTAGEIDGQLVPWSRLEEVYSYVGMTTYTNHVSAALHGTKLYVYTGSGITPDASETVSFFYIKKPTSIYGGGATDATYLDVPDEYVDLVIMHAQGKAYQKLGSVQQKADVDQDITNRLNDVRAAFAHEMQMFNVEMPQGQQTPRLR